MFMIVVPTENKETVPLGKSVKEEKEGDSLEVLHQCKTTSLANSIEQGSTLRDLLTTTAGKLKLGSTDAGIAFAPVYSTASQVHGAGTLVMSRCAAFAVFPPYLHLFLVGHLLSRPPHKLIFLVLALALCNE